MSGMSLPCPTCEAKVTVPGEPPRQKDAISELDNYLVRHWRGELSLGTSYWVNGFLGTFLIIIVAKTLDAAEDSMSLKLYAALSLIVFTTAILISIWQLVGIWRSASNNGASIWVLLAKVGVIFGIVRCVRFQTTQPDLNATRNPRQSKPRLSADPHVLHVFARNSPTGWSRLNTLNNLSDTANPSSVLNGFTSS